MYEFKTEVFRENFICHERISHKAHKAKTIRKLIDNSGKSTLSGSNTKTDQNCIALQRSLLDWQKVAKNNAYKDILRRSKISDAASTDVKDMNNVLRCLRKYNDVFLKFFMIFNPSFSFQI